MRDLVVRLVAALTLTAAACGGSGVSSVGTPSSTPSARFPVTIAASNGPVTIEKAPSRVVSLSPTATEMLFAIGAGPQVVAVDDQSNFPTNAPKTNLSGFQPNIEAIASRRPDLVVIADDTSKLVASLAKLSIPVILQGPARSLDDAYAQIEQLGTATGNVAGAQGVVKSIREDIAEIVASLPKFDRTLSYYHELDDNYFSATSKTFIGQVYSLVGLRNIADAADKVGSGYPRLSAEYIISSDPDLVFLADTKCCKQSVAMLAKRPGWDKIEAVRTGAVVELDDDVASRWGPRVVDLLRSVVAKLDQLEKAAA